MDKSTDLPIVTLIRMDKSPLSTNNVVNFNPSAHKMTVLLTHSIEHITEAFLLTGKFLFNRGEWFIDTRYTITKQQWEDLLKLEDTLPPEKVTIFKVAPHKGDGPKTTHADDTWHINHGGVYYVGPGFQRLSNALPHKIRELYEVHHTFSHYEASYRRYPYPVRVLTSPWDAEDGRHVVSELSRLYPTYGLDVKAVKTSLPIRDAHRTTLPFSSPVLMIDSDFVPTGSLALMYEPKGDEINYVHLWHTKNNFNTAVYGHGSPKLMSHTSMDFDRPGVDMTTSCARHGIKIHPEVVGIHDFGKTTETLWRTTFREVYKLATAKPDPSTLAILEAWTSTKNSVSKHAAMKALEYARKGETIAVNDYAQLMKLYLEPVHGNCETE